MHGQERERERERVVIRQHGIRRENSSFFELTSKNKIIYLRIHWTAVACWRLFIMTSILSDFNAAWTLSRSEVLSTYDARLSKTKWTSFAERNFCVSSFCVSSLVYGSGYASSSLLGAHNHFTSFDWTYREMCFYMCVSNGGLGYLMCASWCLWITYLWQRVQMNVEWETLTIVKITYSFNFHGYCNISD